MFTLYTIALFLHIVGALGMFAGFAIEWVALLSLRKASEIQAAKQWLGIYAGIGRIGGPAGILLILSGFYLSISTWGFPVWIHFTFVLIILMVLIGIFMSGRYIMALGKQISSSVTLLPEQKARLNDTKFLYSLALRTALALVIVLLMTVKPEFVGSIVSLILGVGIAGLLVNVKKK